jgi:hypothetical protein
MERIRRHFSGRFFEHPTVDFDCAAKLLITARELVYVDRSFSVAGSTASSNSSAVGRFARVQEINAGLTRDEGPRFEVPGFPFTSRIGVAGSILATLHWFTQRYGLPMEGWEENFLSALEIDCSRAEDRTGFDLHVAACRDALARWRGGALLDAFDPRFVPRGRSAAYTGLIGTNLFVDEAIGGCRTPAEFFGYVSDILPPADTLRYMFDAVPPSDAATVAA